MALDSEDVATYATAVATIVGAVAVAPVLIIKDKATSIIYSFWENLYPTQRTTSDHNSFQPALTEHTDEDDWSVLTMGGS